MVGEIAATSSLCSVSGPPLSLVYFHTPLEITPEEEVAGVEMRDRAGHSIFPLCEITQAGNILLRSRIAVLAV